MKMEHIPKGWKPCTMLGNSLLRDKELDIREEITLRTWLFHDDPGIYWIEWINMSRESTEMGVLFHGTSRDF